MKPQRYNDGRDRIVVRVEHKLTRNEVIGLLVDCHKVFNPEGDWSEQTFLDHGRRLLVSDGRSVCDDYRNDGPAGDWARRQVKRWWST